MTRVSKLISVVNEIQSRWQRFHKNFPNAERGTNENGRETKIGREMDTVNPAKSEWKQG